MGCAEQSPCGMNQKTGPLKRIEKEKRNPSFCWRQITSQKKSEKRDVLRSLSVREAAFILKYRVSPAVYPAPQEDLSLAIRYVREHALEYGVDPDNILTLGASAGGHLCASQAALAKRVEDTPDKICLCYPVISFTEEPHEGSAELLTGGDTSLRKMLSAENLVTESYPETFVWTCADDDCVPPSNAVRMGAALKKAHVRHELFVYPSGGHGCGLAFSKEAHDWSRAMVEFFKDQQ